MCINSFLNGEWVDSTYDKGEKQSRVHDVWERGVNLLCECPALSKARQDILGAAYLEPKNVTIAFIKSAINFSEKTDRMR